jgi:uncharacterized protein (DUF983 family)
MIQGQKAPSASPILTFEDQEREDEQASRFVSQLQVGDLCPACGKAHLDYDGLLNLTCSACGYTLSGSFT